MSVKTGLDNLVQNNFKQLAGAKIGLIANQSTVDSNLNHIADLLFENKSCKLLKIFAPEHGFRGELQDMASVDSSIDKKTGLPIISLYGKSEESFAPSVEQLKDIDILVADLPDIGSRYYTFAQTIGYTLKIAAKAGIKVVLLDRPNPINGVDIEGSPLSKACRSFCGYAPVPQRHGLTLGELCLLMNQGFGEGEDRLEAANANLEIIKITNWKREQYFDETKIPWVIPSPNMPTLDTAIVYPGSCLIEATQISEARGTTRPFEFIGAPGIDADKLITEIYKQGVELKGAKLRAISFMPMFQKHAKTLCSGVQIHVTSRKDFKSFYWFLAMILSLKKTHPDIFSWRKEAYEFVKDIPAIDLLFGSSEFREVVASKGSLEKILAKCQSFENKFREERKKFLLY